MEQKIGVYGGGFDPIHNGHLLIAKNIFKILRLDKIIFVPTGNASHKNIKTDKNHRFNMTTLAVEGSNFFEVSDYEINKKEKSYTVDTVNHIKANNPYAEIYLIIGSDEFLEINTWHEVNILLKSCNLVVAFRPGSNNKNILLDQLRKVRKKYSPNIFLLDVNAIDISSEDIRTKILLDKNIEYLVPKKVCDYIKINKLYSLYSRVSIPDIKKYLLENMTNKRYLHSISMSETAIDLARLYKENIYKTYIAGLLHDCAKEVPDADKIRMCNEYKIKLDRVLTQQPDLTHAFLAEAMAIKKFHVNDIDILNAIRYHTTGRKRMSMLEKIIYIADCTEPNRVYENVKFVRRLSYENINSAVAYCLKFNIEDNKKKGRLVHQLSIDALQFYKSSLVFKQKK